MDARTPMRHPRAARGGERTGADAEHAISGGAVQARYVYGPGSDEVLVWYAGAGTGDRRWLHADERGSIVAVSDAGGNALAINSYDEYGVPGSGNMGRFQYTGQTWLPTLGLYNYKARMYSSRLGRFLQTDPIGYGDGMNWYNYVGGDPVNGTDPSGEAKVDCSPTDICVFGKRLEYTYGPTIGSGFFILQGGSEDVDEDVVGPDGEVLVVGRRPRKGYRPGLRAPQNNQPQPPVCPAPSNVSLSGTIVTGPAGPAYFSGTLKDVSTGRTYSVSGFGYGGGFVVGTYDVRGTVAGFNALSNGLDISFAQGPYGSGGARFSDNNGRSIGEGSVSGAVAPPIGAGGVSFDPPRVRQTNRGNCR